MNSGDIGKRSDTGPQEAFDTKFDTKFDEEFDVVVVGYGFAGGVAAIEAAYGPGGINVGLNQGRAAGAGIPAFYTPTSFGTELAEGKPTEEFDGKMYVRERWLKADYALIKGQDGDRTGNLTYRMAGRNFNPLMAMAAARTIAQVSVLSEPGSIDPQEVITPGIFVDAIVEVIEPQQEEVLVRTGVVY